MKGNLKNASFLCWRCIQDKNLNEGKRIYFTDLILRKESSNHFDYVCPVCESVIICCGGKL